MKSYLKLFPVILFPYSIVLVLVCAYKHYFMDTILLSVLILYIVSLVSVNIYVKNKRNKWSSQELLHINMVIKLIHIPAYIFIFIIGLFSLTTIFTMVFSIILMIFDGMVIILTGIIGSAGIKKGLSENKLSQKLADTHSDLQFVFCADVISSIIIYKEVKAGYENYDQNIN